MVRSYIISATKANNLYWLGRYEMRVYQTLHQLGKCFDEMIDGDPQKYRAFWAKLDSVVGYDNNEQFTLGMLYDLDNPSSVISAQKRAMDNAILLREDIMTETLSYLEMSVALMNRCKASNEKCLSHLQPIIDWSLAFWGSAEQRVLNHRALNIMMIGRNVENLDILIRFSYPFHRVALAYKTLKRYCREMMEIVDEQMLDTIDGMLTEPSFNLDNGEYKYKLTECINKLVRV